MKGKHMDIYKTISDTDMAHMYPNTTLKGSNNMTREQYEELKARTNTPMLDKYKYKALGHIKQYNTSDNSDELFKQLLLESALQAIWDYNDVSKFEHDYEDYIIMTYRVSKGRLHYDFIWRRR